MVIDIKIYYKICIMKVKIMNKKTIFQFICEVNYNNHHKNTTERVFLKRTERILIRTDELGWFPYTNENWYF